MYDAATRPFLLLTVVVLAFFVSLGPSQAQSNPIVVQLKELDRLIAQKQYREVVRRASALRAQIRSQTGNATFLSDAYVIATRSQAYAHGELSEFKQAEALYKEALDTRKKSYSANSSEVAVESANLAGLLEKMGNNVDAARYFEEVIRIRKSQKDDDAVANVSNTLAGIYKNLGQNTRAEELYKSALERYANKHGNDDSGTALYLNNLGSFYEGIGRLAEAASAIKRALEIMKAKGDAPGITVYSNNLAGVYQKQGRFDDAEALYKAAIASTPTAAVYYNNLGMLYLSRAASATDRTEKTRWQKSAEVNLRKALEIEISKSGETSVGVATYRFNLAQSATIDRKYDDAARLFAAAVASGSQSVGRERLRLVAPLQEWAWLDVLNDRVTTDTVSRSRQAVGILVPVVEEELRLQQGRDSPSQLNPWDTHARVLYEGMQRGVVDSKAIAEAFETVQRAQRPAVAVAVSQMAARIAAARDPLAKIVREQQDILVESRLIDQQLLSERVKPPEQRNAAVLEAATLAKGKASTRLDCMSSEHFGQFAWQFKRTSGSSGLKVQAAIAC
jgi:tetratricopeptide (TPR) repeat protein